MRQVYFIAGSRFTSEIEEILKQRLEMNGLFETIKENKEQKNSDSTIEGI